MKTPEFNKFETQNRKFKAFNGMAVASIVLMGAYAIYGINSTYEEHKKIAERVGFKDCISMISCIEVVLLAILLGSEIAAWCAVDKRDDARRQLKNIVFDYTKEAGYPDYKHAKMVAEYVLQYMTDTEKTTIAKFYKVTDFNKATNVAVFVAKVKEIADNVIKREPAMSKTLTYIANCKTYMCPNWDYGRGGR